MLLSMASSSRQRPTYVELLGMSLLGGGRYFWLAVAWLNMEIKLKDGKQAMSPTRQLTMSLPFTLIYQDILIVDTAYKINSYYPRQYIPGMYVWCSTRQVRNNDNGKDSPVARL